jgi:cobalt-zinc-cadmium efflux system protein
MARDLVESVPGVRDVHHMHVWSMDGSRTMATLHACLNEGIDAHGAVTAIKARLAAEHGIEHATVEPEYGHCADGDGDHDHHHGSGGHDHDDEGHGHAHGALHGAPADRRHYH